jgi:uncharacterized membrane protein YhaH (DUF805 family)
MSPRRPRPPAGFCFSRVRRFCALTPREPRVHPDNHMRYYYLQADNTPGGPESLETLVAMVASGQITLATLVVPAGGEDWTPLARVLGFYYADAQSQTTGPVPFSELSRLQQVQALNAESWVLPQGGQQWIALKEVLTAGGVAPAQPAAVPVVQPRAATAPVRHVGARTAPVGGAGEANPYAAPRTQVRRVVVHHPTGGLGRLKYFLFGLAATVVFYGIILLAGWNLFATTFDAALNSGGKLSDAEMKTLSETVGNRTVLIFAGAGLVFFAVSIWLAVQRNRNIGWHGAFVLFSFVPLLNIWYSFALLAYPSGYARHRRFDTVTKVLLGICIGLVVLWIGLFAYGFSKAKSSGALDSEKRSVDDISRSLEESLRNRPSQPQQP